MPARLYTFSCETNTLITRTLSHFTEASVAAACHHTSIPAERGRSCTGIETQALTHSAVAFPSSAQTTQEDNEKRLSNLVKFPHRSSLTARYAP